MLNVSTVAVIMAVPALVWAGSSNVRPLEATIQMERFAGKLDHAKTVHPDTVREITRLMSQPWYDCNRVICSKQLQARNRAVRDRLAIASQRDVAPPGIEQVTGGNAVGTASELETRE